VTSSKQQHEELSSSSLLFPIHRVYCVGKNYADHVQEMGGDVTRSTPVFFTKPNDGVVYAPKDSQTPVVYPLQTTNLHYEVELVVAIGSNVSSSETTAIEDCIYGFAVGIDLTRRDLQSAAKEKRGPWDVAKYFDQSAPMGSISSHITLKDLKSSNISLQVNGVTKQSAPLRNMIWSVPEIIKELTKSFVLKPGDLIMTGTPAGVGPIHVGDHVVGKVDGLEDVDMVLV